MTLPEDLMLNSRDDVTIRQDLVLTALGRRPADLAIRVGRLLHVHSQTHLTPEFEAALVLPKGNTWTCEASHEFANVNGLRNVEFWQRARRRGIPHKVFIQPGSAVPPSA